MSSFEIGLKVESVGKDVWTAEINSDDLARLGKPLAASGARTVIGLSALRTVGDSIFFFPNDVSVLNAGQSKEAVIVKLGTTQKAANNRKGEFTAGDDAFIRECQKLLPPEVARLASELIARVRSEFPGRMHEGKARKWVNYPSNFLAITVQNRDQSLAIHVKGRPDKHPHSNLELRDDRPGYSRFKISKSPELAPALDVIRRSARL